MTGAVRSHRKPRYDAGCAAAHALGIVGDRWALLVVRELMFSAKRFQLLRSGMPGITPSVLSSRLDELEASGIVRHDAVLGSYALTESGLALRPVLHQLGVWGVGRPGHDPSKFLSPSSLMLSLPVMVDHAVAQRFSGLIGVDTGVEQFTVSLDDDGEPVVRAGEPEHDGADAVAATFHGPAAAIAETLYAPADLDALLSRGPVRITGDLAAARAFTTCFRKLAPPPATPTNAP